MKDAMQRSAASAALGLLVFVFCCPNVATAIVIWHAVAGMVSVNVSDDFVYSVAVNGSAWLAGGGVTVRCRGQNFSSNLKSTAANATYNLRPPQRLLRIGKVKVSEGEDPELGAYSAATQVWQAPGACELQTAVRFYPNHEAFEFTTLFPDGADETAIAAMPRLPTPLKPGPVSSTTFGFPSSFATNA